MATAEPYGEIIAFLLKDPNNIESAFDLADIFPRVLDQLQVKFWETLKIVTESGLVKREGEDWTVEFEVANKASPEAGDFLTPNSDWSALTVVQNSARKMDMYCKFFIAQDYKVTPRKRDPGAFARIAVGIGFSDNLNKHQQAKLPKKAFTLQKDLGKDWVDYDHQLDDGILARKKLAPTLRARSETISLSQGNSLEEEVASAFFNLFDRTRNDVEVINAALSKSKS